MAPKRAPGYRVRFAKIPGATAKGVLSADMYLPCILGEFDVSEEFEWRDYTTVGAGEFSAPAGGGTASRLLRSSDLETLTVDWHRLARFLTNPLITPEKVKSELYKLGRSRTPFSILIVEQLGGGDEELRMNATLRGVRRVTRPGEADTRYYTLTIKEWRNNEVDRRGEGGGARKLPTTARLTAKTTLASLSRTFYPDLTVGEGWRLIAAANKLTGWGANTAIVKHKKWKLGDKVKIPKVPGGKLVQGSIKYVR